MDNRRVRLKWSTTGALEHRPFETQKKPPPAQRAATQVITVSTLCDPYQVACRT